MNDTTTARASVDLKASAEKVWDALTDPAKIKQYLFGTDTECDWRVGSRIYYRGEWEGKHYEDKGEILEIEFAKKIDAQVIVRGLRVFSDFEFEFRMALANQRLAGAAVETVALITAEQHTFLSSSTVREIAMLQGNVSSMVPPHVERALKEKVAQMGEQSLPNALRD